jgi:PD-(D/E)XK nuclease superfamily
VLDLGDGTHGIVGVDVKYHDWLKPEIPKPSNLARYLEVADRSGAFAPGATVQVKGRSELAVMWLEHLLLLSMLQHPSGTWTWGRYVVVHPAGNVDVAAGCARYRGLRADESTFATSTLEALLDGHALPKATEVALRARYVVPSRSTGTDLS